MRLFLSFFFCVICIGHPSSVFASTRVVTEEATIYAFADTSAVVPGEEFRVALTFELEPGWHVYWKNPGASGLPLELDWDLAEGMQAGAIEWPTPERIYMGGLVNYGYEDRVTFMVPIQVADSFDLSGEITFSVDAFWLICKEVCLPAEGRFEWRLPVRESGTAADGEVFQKAKDSLPRVASELPWSVGALTEGSELVVRISGDELNGLPDAAYFYAEELGVVNVNAEQILKRVGKDFAELRVPLTPAFLEAPKLLVNGVLQTSEMSWSVALNLGKGFQGVARTEAMADQSAGGFEAYFLELGLPGWLILAFLGGVILNVMPCVLPVLSLKVFSLLKHSGQTKRQALLHGFTYTVGVVVSFLVLAGALITLRAFGEGIGWGFQLQNPGFLVVLTLIFFLFALNLMGVFELGSSWVGADAGLSKQNDLVGSFGMGVLAAVVGAPCVGPLLAGVGGIAVQVQPAVGLLIFGTMGFGLAAPFLFLAVFPKLVAYLPKPGAWMESVKQFMGFMLIAAVIFLLSVAGAAGGVTAVVALLISLFLASLAAWIYGRWSAPFKSRNSRRGSTAFALVFLGASLWYGIPRVHAAYATTNTVSSNTDAGQWGAWSEKRVQSELAAGNPVFVDFTASWCLICQVNKRFALRTDATSEVFEAAGVVALSADWSRYDPEITAALEAFGRSGVPLYLMYSPDGSVQVLPQSLTNGIIADAVANLNK